MSLHSKKSLFRTRMPQKCYMNSLIIVKSQTNLIGKEFLMICSTHPAFSIMHPFWLHCNTQLMDMMIDWKTPGHMMMSLEFFKTDSQIFLRHANLRLNPRCEFVLWVWRWGDWVSCWKHIRRKWSFLRVGFSSMREQDKGKSGWSTILT